MTKTEGPVIEGDLQVDGTVSAGKPEGRAVAQRARRAPAAVQVAAPIDPVAIYQMAIEKGSDIAVIQNAYEFALKVEANNAKKAYAAAIASCRPQLPVIIKNARVAYDAKQSNGKVDYAHETLAQISEQIDGILGEHGLSYRYKIEQTMPQNATMLVHVTCLVSHAMGHEEPTTLFAAIDIGAGKNHIQAIGSAVTYLQRYTLKAALGLAAAEYDDDGRSAPDAQKPKPTVPRASASNGAAQASAEQAQPTRQQQTSSISSGHQGPIRIDPLKGETYSAWALRFVAAIKTANSAEEIEQWDKLNENLLDEIFNKAKPTYVEINAAMKKQKQAVSGGGKPPADPPAGPVTGASIDMPDEPWAKWEIPNAEKDYESFLSYVGDKLNSWTEDHGDIEAFWNTIIEPAETFPGDKDDLLSLYRKAEQRLGG